MLLDLITIRHIADILIGLRLKDVHARHDVRLLYSISAAARSPEDVKDSDAGAYLPSRRKWVRPPLDARKQMSKGIVTKVSIWRAIHAQARSGGLHSVAWGRNLLRLVEEIKDAICSDTNPAVGAPRIYPIPKTDEHGAQRVVAVCATLQDRIMCGLLARYLEDLIEPLLTDSCYSFRVCGLSHHNAAEALSRYRKRFRDRRLYAAECDIRGFYDGLVHDVAFEAIESAARERGILLDSKARKAFCDTLRSYSFPAYALPTARTILAQRSSTATVDWLPPAEQSRLYEDIPDDRIGIPQGNPISPIIANAVLRKADELMLECLGDEGFYARFCDDIILVHPRKQVVEKAQRGYLALMQELRLPVHPPQEVREYSAGYYDMKSKKPYRWGGPSTKPFAVPWVQFVGYQVRFDGALRIRKSSIERQKREISKLFSLARHLIKHSLRSNTELKKSGEAIYMTLVARIIRAGTGDRRFGPETVGQEPCWIDAFPLIEDNKFTRQQLRELDRHREIQFRKFRFWLQKKGLIASDEQEEGSSKSKPRRYFGAPYSYFGAIGCSQRRYRRSDVDYTGNEASIRTHIVNDILNLLMSGVDHTTNEQQTS